MEPHKHSKKSTVTREEFEVAYYTKELGRPLQRKMLQRKFNDFSDSTISAARHGEDVAPELDTSPPPEDRAG